MKRTDDANRDGETNLWGKMASESATVEGELIDIWLYWFLPPISHCFIPSFTDSLFVSFFFLNSVKTYFLLAPGTLSQFVTYTCQNPKRFQTSLTLAFKINDKMIFQKCDFKLGFNVKLNEDKYTQFCKLWRVRLLLMAEWDWKESVFYSWTRDLKVQSRILLPFRLIRTTSNCRNIYNQ